MKYFLSILMFIVLILLIIRWYFGNEKLYRDEIKTELAKVDLNNIKLITAEDLNKLPKPVRNYLFKAKVVGTPRVKYFRLKMDGYMKLDENKDYAPVKATQYTFIKSGTRLFYITMNFKGVSINGLHHYFANNAFMKIKILDLIKVVDVSGSDMQRAETVTYFNDLCLMAPGALLEEEIEWEVIDDKRVKGTLKKHGHEVSAVLVFNKEGMLENFISDDRMTAEKDGVMKKVTWSTPMSSFGKVGEFYLPKKGEAVWHYPNNDFSYFQANIRDVVVNK